MEKKILEVGKEITFEIIEGGEGSFNLPPGRYSPKLFSLSFGEEDIYVDWWLIGVDLEDGSSLTVGLPVSELKLKGIIK